MFAGLTFFRIEADLVYLNFPQSAALSSLTGKLHLARITPPPIPQRLALFLGSDWPRARTQPHLSSLPFLLRLPVHFCMICMRPGLAPPWVNSKRRTLQEEEAKMASFHARSFPNRLTFQVDHPPASWKARYGFLAKGRVLKPIQARPKLFPIPAHN
ncbi:UNVERIFIED_CONTAM: hypothetical protein K2H54_061747 [Gekko kuhli]